MRNIVLKIAYDGTAYSGWQRQQNSVTVQQVTERALSSLLQENVSLHGAGRTDSGVHAAAQMASFASDNPIPVSALRNAVNNLLPADIGVLGAYELPPGFHPRKTPHQKTYSYSIALQPPQLFAGRYCAYLPAAAQLDIAAMREAAAKLCGEHDFRSFSVSGSDVKSTVRVIDAVNIELMPAYSGELPWQCFPPLLRIDVQGGGFLYKMVRLIAARLVQIGAGEADISLIDKLFATGGEPVKQIPPLPPQGLLLREIKYPGFEAYFVD